MKKYISEIIGTFLLVFLGTGAVLFTGDLLPIAVMFGLALAIGIYTVGQVSGGHFNPAVTIAMFVAKRIEAVEGLLYIISQFIGALLATLSVKGLLQLVNSTGKTQVVLTNLGQNNTQLLGNWGSFLFEAILTFIFLLVILTVTSKKYNQGKLNGIIIGSTLSALVAFGLNITGTGVNPARSFAPAVFAGGDALKVVWVFLLAPVIGAILASLFTHYFLKVDEDAVVETNEIETVEQTKHVATFEPEVDDDAVAKNEAEALDESKNNLFTDVKEDVETKADDVKAEVNEDIDAEGKAVGAEIKDDIEPKDVDINGESEVAPLPKVDDAVTVKDDVKEDIKDDVNAVESKVSDNINETPVDLAKDVKEDVETKVEDVKAEVKEDVEPKGEDIEAKTDDVKSEVKDIKDDVETKAEDVKEDVKDAVESKIEDVKDGVKDVKEDIKDDIKK